MIRFDRGIGLFRTLLALFAAASCGCILSKQSGAGAVQPGFSAPVGAVWLLGRIPDGSGKDGTMVGSGGLVQTSIRAELLRRGVQILPSDALEAGPLLEEAKAKNAAYALLVRITVWTDNATEWSGRRDQAGVAAELYQVSSGTLLASANRTAFGVKHPDRCAPWLAEVVVGAVFGESLNVEGGPPC